MELEEPEVSILHILQISWRLAQYVYSSKKTIQYCKRVLVNLPEAVAKDAFSRKTEQAAAIAASMLNRDLLDPATPARLTLPLLLQYLIVSIP